MAAPRRRRFYARVRSGYRRTRRATHGFATSLRRLGGGIPSWAKPSKVTAYVGVGTGIATLLFTNLPNGDSWIQRIAWGIAGTKAAQGSGDPNALRAAWIGTDGANVGSVLAAQLQQNALPAIGYTAGFGIVAAVLKKVGL